MDRNQRIAELAAIVGDDGTGDLGVIVDSASADDSISDLIEVVLEARRDASVQAEVV